MSVNFGTIVWYKKCEWKRWQWITSMTLGQVSSSGNVIYFFHAWGNIWSWQAHHYLYYTRLYDKGMTGVAQELIPCIDQPSVLKKILGTRHGTCIGLLKGKDCPLCSGLSWQGMYKYFTADACTSKSRWISAPVHEGMSENSDSMI